MGPPPPHVLRGIFWSGYRDAAAWFLNKPEPPNEMCCYRRPTGHNKSVRGSATANNPATGNEEDTETRWHAARAHLQTKPNRQLPTVDPVTGEDVQALIDHAEMMASWVSKATSRVIILVVTTAIVLGFAVLIPSF